MALERGQQVADRAVDRDGVTRGLDAAEGEPAVRVGQEPAPQVPFGLLGVLVLVQADRRGVPDVHLGPGHRPSVGVDHRAGEEERRPLGGRADDRVAIGHHRGALAPERPQQVGRGRLLLAAVVHQADQRRQAEAARHQPHLVVAGGSELAQPGHEVDALVELGLGQPDFAREVVQVAH
jgi:hypothetical protein